MYYIRKKITDNNVLSVQSKESKYVHYNVTFYQVLKEILYIYTAIDI